MGEDEGDQFGSIGTIGDQIGHPARLSAIDGVFENLMNLRFAATPEWG